MSVFSWLGLSFSWLSLEFPPLPFNLSISSFFRVSCLQGNDSLSGLMSIHVFRLLLNLSSPQHISYPFAFACQSGSSLEDKHVKENAPGLLVVQYLAQVKIMRSLGLNSVPGTSLPPLYEIFQSWIPQLYTVEDNILIIRWLKTNKSCGLAQWPIECVW